MTLIEFDNCILDAWEKKDLLPNIQVRLSYIADEFAIGFMNWCILNYNPDGIFTGILDDKELLEIYKKEQQL